MKRLCANTGLSVPECSCRHCLEAMLMSFRPELLGGEMRVRRTSGARGGRSKARPDRTG
jgi:hypothetical protein